MRGAKKSLGQHFLKSERALSVIVNAGKINEKDTVLEIGPGTGALTEKLLAIDCQVLAVEKDDNLYEALKVKFQREIAEKKLILIHDDILNFEPKSYNLEAKNWKLIANIPYNITGAIIRKFLQNPPAGGQPEEMVLLVQKEVAERIVARDGKESILSISVKAYGTPRYMETVKAGSFVPMPKVDSAIIVIENISKDFFQSASRQIPEDKFFEILKTGFKFKRKKLSSNLSAFFTKGKIKETFNKLGLDDNLRAEDVKIETWRKLAQNLAFKPK